MNRILIGGALLAALASAPLAVPRREAAAPATAPEVVSIPDLARTARTPSLAELDLRSAWSACVAMAIAGVPCPPEAEARFIDAFLDGRLPAAAPFVRAKLARLETPEAARLAARARALDRALVLLRPAPAALIRVWIERAEDPDAHVEAARANAEAIESLVADSVLGERAYALLRAAGSVTAATRRTLSGRVGRDAWARRALSLQGSEATLALLEALESVDPMRRAAGAWVLAGIDASSYGDRILQTALPELARDATPGNAGFAIRALSALGDRARPAVRGLLRSGDDQAVAAALQVLLRTGGAAPEDLEAARPRVERLAARAGEAGDEAAIGLELRASLGVVPGAMAVPDPPDRLRASQVESSGPERSSP